MAELDGEHHTACALDCPDMCGLAVTVEAGKLVRIEGDHRSPITDGFICGKVRKIAKHVYSSERVRAPRVRVGAKGSGAWRTASWDEALGLVADRIATIRTRAGGQAILPYHYGGSNGFLTEGALATRFFRRLGATTLERTYCAAATTAAAQGMYGVMPGVALEDFAHAKLIVLWGANPSVTGIHLVPIVERARAAGAKLVVIDPRMTPLARRADLHLQIRPGTDLPVALAAIHALFVRGHVDRGFLAAHAREVDELAIRAARWSIGDAAAAAGIEARALDRLVEMYARAVPAVIRVGWGVERNRNGGSAIAAILAIPAVAGKLGVRGGGYTLSNGDARWEITPETAIGEPPAGTRVVNMAELPRALRRLQDPRIECLFVYNCNPVATAPAQREVIEALSRDDLFVVVHEQVMTDTAELADVVLPATTFLEHRDLRLGYGAMRLYDSGPVIAPVGEARTNNQLFGALLDRFGLVRDGDAMTEDELVARTFAAAPHGEELRVELAHRGVAFPPNGARPIPFAEVFPDTPDGKIHLVPATLDVQACGLYTYKPDPATPEYPLALISPATTKQISSTFGHLRKELAEIEIAPADAGSRGIADGDRVRVWNAGGEVHCLAKVTDDMRPGVCAMPKGLWRRHTANGFTSNALVPQTFADLGGQATWNDARVQLAKLT